MQGGLRPTTSRNGGASRRWHLLLPPATLLLAGCEGPRLPAQVTVAGVSLDRANTWEQDDVSGSVFVTPGAKMDAAPLQVSVVIGRRNRSADELRTWILDRYRRARHLPLHEDTARSGEACHAGTVPGPPPREAPRAFVTVQVCRAEKGVAVCAGADERIGDDVIVECLYEEPCWDKLCAQKLSLWRAPLEALVRGSLEGR